MNAFFELRLIDKMSADRGPVLLNPDAIESVTPALGGYYGHEVIGCNIRTRSGDTHRVQGDSEAIKQMFLQAMEGSE